VGIKPVDNVDKSVNNLFGLVSTVDKAVIFYGLLMLLCLPQNNQTFSLI